MKTLNFFLVIFFNVASLFGQDAKTSGANSPAVIARNFSATYGVRADAIEAILWIYEAEGYDDVDRRKRATEQIIREYAQSPEKQQKTDVLSDATRRKLGISDAPKIANALEWDLFARSHYLSTTGQNSPAVMAQGDVNIWYGIPPKALRALGAQLEKNQTDLANFETQLADQVKKYEELKTELETYGSKEEIYKKAEALLEEGRLEEAEQLIEADYRASKKRQAYKGYVFGKAKALLFKYDEAAEGYRDAVFMDNKNSTYHLYYANNENTIYHYDEAIRHFEIALGIDSLKSGNEEQIATLINNLGGAWSSKGEHNKAIGYFERALQIYVKAFGENHPSVAVEYNNLGSSWSSKGEHDKAIGYYERALQIYVKAFGENHPDVAQVYNNLGAAWSFKGEYDKAIGYFEKSLQIYVNAFGENHPKVAPRYNNLGYTWSLRGEYDKAIEYFEKCQKVLDFFLKPTDPIQRTTARNLSLAANNQGMKLYGEKNHREALRYFEKSLQNAQKAGDDTFELFSLYNIGNMQKQLQKYEEGLLTLDTGLEKATQIQEQIDKVQEQLTPEMLAKPEVQAKIASMRNLAVIRIMQYRKVGCLKGLKRDKEAETLARQLWQECIKTNDTQTLEDLKQEGYDFGKD